jgi:DNA-binding PadR family transcriptional regulator
MQSPVNWALLGLVIERPSYAYELAQRFERSYDGALALASTSHVYTAIDALRSRLLIEEIPGTRSGRQPKPHYRATALGVEAYREWLVGQLDAERRRQRLFVAQLAVLRNNPQTALAIVEEYEQACLKEAAKIPIAHREGSTFDRLSELPARLIAEESRLAIGAKLAWIEYARQELKAISDARSPRP